MQSLASAYGPTEAVTARTHCAQPFAGINPQASENWWQMVCNTAALAAAGGSAAPVEQLQVIRKPHRNGGLMPMACIAEIKQWRRLVRQLNFILFGGVQQRGRNIWVSRCSTYTSSTVLRRYVHGRDTDEPLVWYEGSGTSDRRWLHQDERASVVAVSDAAGAVFNINTYDEFGIPASANLGKFQYTGQIWLADVGMFYYEARIYSPTLGRFMQTDPVGYDDDFNLYAYVKNDPINNVDPDGQACTPLNSSSVYCLRRDIYVIYDQAVHSETRFFAAAARTVEYLADNDIPGASLIGPSAQAQAFLKQVSASLYTLNASAFADIRAGRLSGPGLDDRMISAEQTRVQSMLDALPNESRAAVVKSFNSAFASQVAAFLSGMNSSNAADNRVLASVVKGLGRPIDFGRQSDREAIGKTLVADLRKSGACGITGSRISRC